MSKHEPVKEGPAKWLEMDEILEFLHGGFRQKARARRAKASFAELKGVCLGMGVGVTFHVV